ncbi:hypothetical protein AB0K60_23495 [Thermopolyspora sp. NPDC052614]|uniref:hypothetical protein n=1 Tax=Thermopolyspora sp. NPDC052614 TaxID=3155682 RepID=UPI00342651A5
MLGRIWDGTWGRAAVVVAVIVVLAVGAGGAAWVWLDGEEPAAPRTYRGERSTAIYAPIATRERDPRPLTREEVLGPATATVKAGGVAMVRRSASLTGDCASVVSGEAAEALAGCTQVLRAVYASRDGDVSGQFLVFNMADATAADALVAAVDPAAGRGFARLAPDQPASFDAARSWAQARALGHFVTLSWVGPVGDERPDLTGPQLALDGLGRALQQRVVDAE